LTVPAATSFAVTMSSRPSRFKSPTATEKGDDPTAGAGESATKLGAALPGAVVLRSTLTVLLLELAATISSFPSRFMSPTATANGTPPMGTGVPADNDAAPTGAPVPLTSTLTVSSPKLAVIRSGFPSRLRSAADTANGPTPTANESETVKLNVPPATVVL